MPELAETNVITMKTKAKGFQQSQYDSSTQILTFLYQTETRS